MSTIQYTHSEPVAERALLKDSRAARDEMRQPTAGRLTPMNNEMAPAPLDYATAQRLGGDGAISPNLPA